MFFLFFFSIIIIIFMTINNNKFINKYILYVYIFFFNFLTILLIFFNYFLNYQNFIKINWSDTLTSNNWGKEMLSLDGISLWFIFLSNLLIIIVLILSWNNIKIFKKEFLILNFILFIMLIGVFSTTDLLWFFILFESVLIPMFIIIGIWGNRKEKIKAAYYFFFYTFTGSIGMLLSIFNLYYIIGTTNYTMLLYIELPVYTQFWVFIGFFLSLAVKIPMIPFHIWLPQAHVEAPTSGSILLAGILLKLGGYGMIRLMFPLLPISSKYFSPFIILISLIGIIYGGLNTIRQNDMKRLIAYSSISHMGLVTLAIFTHSLEGLIGSYLLMLSHGLTSSGLFMAVGILYDRFHVRTIKYFKGLVIIMPIFSIIFFLLIISNTSFPVTFNFISELYCLVSAFKYSFFTGIFTVLSVFLSAIYSFFLLNRILFGSLSMFLKKTIEINLREFSSYFLIIIPTLFLGFNPFFVINSILTSAYYNISF